MSFLIAMWLETKERGKGPCMGVCSMHEFWGSHVARNKEKGKANEGKEKESKKERKKDRKKESGEIASASVLCACRFRGAKSME